VPPHKSAARGGPPHRPSLATPLRELPFTLHRQQPEKYKQNVDVVPHGKLSADAHGKGSWAGADTGGDAGVASFPTRPKEVLTLHVISLKIIAKIFLHCTLLAKDGKF